MDLAQKLEEIRVALLRLNQETDYDKAHKDADSYLIDVIALFREAHPEHAQGLLDLLIAYEGMDANFFKYRPK